MPSSYQKTGKAPMLVQGIRRLLTKAGQAHSVQLMKFAQIFAFIVLVIPGSVFAAPINCKATLFKTTAQPTQVSSFVETSLEGAPYYTAKIENVSYSVLETETEGLLGNIEVAPDRKSTLVEAIAISGALDAHKNSQLIFSALSFGQATITCGE